MPENRDYPLAGPGVTDEWVAWNIRMQREDRGWSQADLAQKMAALGWKYHPQTVHRVESGQRKVTIGEAEALARLFSVTLDALTWPDMVTHAAARLGMFIERGDAAFERIAEQASGLLFALEHLERGVAEVSRLAAAGDELVREQIAEARSVLEKATPELAVEEGRSRYAEWRATAPDSAWDVTGEGRFPRPPRTGR